MKTTVKAPPSSPGKPFIGQLLIFRRDPLKFLSGIATEHGDIVHFKLGPQDMYLLNNPIYIRDVLVTNSRNFEKSRGLQMAKKFLGESLLTSEGEFHRRQRRLAQPAFHRQRINAYGEVMADYGAKAAARWHEGETLDMSQEMMRLTLAVVGKTLFDADEVESEASEIGAALTDVMQLFKRITNPFSVLLDKLPLPSNIRWLKAKERLDSTINRIIAQRRVVEARLHEEVTTVLAGRLPGAEDVARLPYTEMVLAESMRLSPPAWTLGRRAVADYQVGEYIIPADSI